MKWTDFCLVTCAFVSASWAKPAFAHPQGSPIFVGASSDVGDGLDDTNALLAAIQAAGAGPATIEFYSGVYDFFVTEDPVTFAISDAEDITIIGNGATLRLHGFDPNVLGGGYPKQLFEFSNIDGDGISLSDLTVEMVREPYSIGVAVGADEVQGWFDVEFDTTVYPDIDDDFQIQRVDDCEPLGGTGPPGIHADHMHMLLNPADYTITELPPGATTRTFRVQLTNPTPFDLNQLAELPQDEPLMIGHSKFRTHFTLSRQCTGVEVVDVTVHDMPGMGVLARNSGDVLVDGLQLLPAPGRLLSISADGVHLIDCTGDVTVRNCTMIRMGDDGLNVHGRYLRVDCVLWDPSSQHLYCNTANEETYFDFEWANGEDVQFYDPNLALGPMTPLLSPPSMQPVTFPCSADITLEVDSSVGVSVGDYVTNLSRSAASVTVENCHIEGNASKGMVVKADPVTITGCVLVNNAGPAIAINTDVTRFGESKGVANVLIENCTVDGSNRFSTRFRGAVTVKAEIEDVNGTPILPPGPVHAYVTVQNTTFRNLSNLTSCTAVQCTNRSAVYLGAVLEPALNSCTFEGIDPAELKLVILENAPGPSTNGANLVTGVATGIVEIEGIDVQVSGSF